MTPQNDGNNAAALLSCECNYGMNEERSCKNVITARVGMIDGGEHTKSSSLPRPP